MVEHTNSEAALCVPYGWLIWDWRNTTIFTNTRRPVFNILQKAKDLMVILEILDPPVNVNNHAQSNIPLLL